MTLTAFFSIFLTVFLAELGDKTQLATVLFASEKGGSLIPVFLAASLALVASTVLAVLLGGFASKFIAFVPVKLIAGLGFVIIGGWTVFDHFKG